MATPRLPVPGHDDGVWGTVLNDYLSQAHNDNGTLKASAISDAGGYLLPGGGIPSADMDAAVRASLARADSAAQSTSSLADAYLTAYNLKTAVGDPLQWAQASTTNTGEFWAALVPWPHGMTITNIVVGVTGTGTYSSNGAENVLVLYDLAGNLLSKTADDPTIWSSGTGLISRPLASPQTNNGSDTFVYLAAIVQGFPSVQLRFPTVVTTASMLLTAGGQYRGIYLSGQTSTPASFAPGGSGATGYILWIAAS